MSYFHAWMIIVHISTKRMMMRSITSCLLLLRVRAKLLMGILVGLIVGLLLAVRMVMCTCIGG